MTFEKWLERVPEGQLSIGRCDPCQVAFDKKQKDQHRLMLENNRRGRAEAPDLEMPDLAPELQTEFGLDEKPGFEVQRRDWDD